ncbi:retrotransposon protein, putative, ty1-copia subclass [Tanacetum coccineum]
MNTSSGIGVSTESDDTMNEDTPVGVASAVKEDVTPSVVDMTVEMEKINSLEDTTVLGSFPPLSKPVTTTAGNAPGKSSYVNVTSKPSGKKLNICTLFTPGGNGIDVVVPVKSIRAISERFANTSYGFFFGKRVAYLVVANYVRNTWGKYGLVRFMFSSSTGLFSFQSSSMEGLDAMLENGPWFIRNHPLILKKWHPGENLLKEDVSIISVWVKLHGVPVTAFSEDGLSAIVTKPGTPLMLDFYTSDMCMQSWGRSSYARVMIELRADVECASCKVLGHIHEECPKNTGAGEKKTLRKPSQTSRGVPVGLKMGFKPQKEYRPILKKPTASSSVNKKKGVEPTIEVSNSNPFEVLNSIDNDVELGTNGGTANLWQVILMDEAGNPLKKVEFPGDYDSEDEVASVDNDMARSMASERVGFGTQSLLEQWRDSYGNGDDDDMYEGQDLPQELQSICDNLDIRVREEDNSESEDEQSVGFIKEDFDGSDIEKEGDNNAIFAYGIKKRKCGGENGKSMKREYPFPLEFTPCDETEVECDKSLWVYCSSGSDNGKGNRFYWFKEKQQDRN